MKILTISTQQKDEIIDITDRVESYLRESQTENGLCTVFVAHTTSAITTADLDPGTDRDFIDALRGMLPHLKYRHPHDPGHAPDHLLSSIIGPSVTVPYANGRLLLGVWQRVVLVELDGPRQRTVHVSHTE